MKDSVPLRKLDARPVPRSFFNRDPRRVARELLGKLLLRAGKNKTFLAARIVETEAYLGLSDPAAHAFNGVTPRNAVLFGPPGHAYVYFIYGTHFCLNVTCQPLGKPGCVLFRALEPVAGEEIMAVRRGVVLTGPRDLPKLTGGPGRLTQAFGITRQQDNACDLTSPSSGLWIADDGFRPSGIRRTPRIGIRKAKDHRLRYLIANNPFVSGPKRLNPQP
jgi:DNA-3-methyladenine glycosylase